MRHGIALMVVITLAGCSTTPVSQQAEGPAVMTAAYTARPILVDGKLNDAIWQDAPVYPLHLADDRDPSGADKVRESATAQLAWDDHYFYLGVRYTDSDVVATGTKRNAYHFQTGDVAELFLKPQNNPWYWELYVTPHSMTSTFYFEDRDKHRPENFTYQMEIAVSGCVEGTLNQSGDTDTAWTGEIAVPITELTKNGDDFPSDLWTILVARYNYSRALGDEPELTMAPRLPVTSYHHHEGYATIRFEK